jgi:hypothetical protein
MSEWNDAIELAAQLCEKLQRELRGASSGGALEEHVKHALTTFGVAASRIRELKKPELRLPRPAVGRIVHTMIRQGSGDRGLVLRPAIIVRVGPHLVDQEDKPGLVSLFVFTALGDGVADIAFDSLPSPEGGEWLARTWRWPPRV